MESALLHARREELPAELTLVEWLSTLSDFRGKCSFCDEYHGTVIEMVDKSLGLVYDNVVPLCRACHRVRKEGMLSMERRVRTYLHAERVQHTLGKSGQEEE